MIKIPGIYNTDEIGRDNSRFPIGSLDEIVWWQSQTAGSPLHMSHDYQRLVGWNEIKGLYIAHECSYVIGYSYLPENEGERMILQKARDAFLTKSIKQTIEKDINAFSDELSKHGLHRENSFVKLFYNNISLFGYDNILYDAFPKLKEYVEEDGLILLERILKDFVYLGQGVFKSKRNQLAILLHSFFRRSCSIFNNFNFDFIDQLFEVYKQGNHSVKVRLETDFIGYAPSWLQGFEYDFWYGPKYSDDIASIPEGLTRYESDAKDKVYTNIKSTEFIWEKKDDGKKYQFEMEEVVSGDAPTLQDGGYGCRYLHAFYNFKDKEFDHFDGAIRIYDSEQIVERREVPMNEMGHRAKYVKIFRLDGHIPLSQWKSLITHYLSFNNSVYDYFGISRPNQLESEDEIQREKSIQDYVPYLINKGDGVRLYISYHPEVRYERKRNFCQFDNVTLEDGVHAYIDYATIEVIKALHKVGAEIEMPKEVKIVLIEDYIHNIPRIFHSDEKESFQDVNDTLKGIRMLIAQHVWNHDNEIYSFSLGWNMDGRSVSVSFLGHVEDLNKWLSSFVTLPIKRKEFQEWLCKQNTYIHKFGKESPSPIHATHIMNDGMLNLMHRTVQKDLIIRDIKCDKVGVKGESEMIDTFLAQLWKEGKIFTAPLYVVEDARDEKTGGSYFTSPHSCVFHETTCVLDNAPLITYVWTVCPNVKL